jgi:monomeric isocitrate dehydrogenase
MNGKKRIKSVKSSKNTRGQKPLKSKFLKVSALKKKSPKSKKKENIKVKRDRSLRKAINPRIKTHPSKRKASIKAAVKAKSATVGVRSVEKNKIVRIMGQGQFMVANKILKTLNDIDNSIVQLVSNDRSDDTEFRKRLIELTEIVETNGKQLDPKEIIQSDIILPSPDLSIEEAKRLFKGDGVVPEF